MGEVEPPKVKRTRRKPIKSCTFCRKRKLRCDQKKPICSACAQRNLTDCTYTSSPLKESIPNKINASNKSTTREKVSRTIAFLEEQLRRAKGQTMINPMREMYYFRSKKTGKNILYGPTAVMTFVLRTYWGNSENFRLLQEKMHSGRKQLKQQHGRYMLQENVLIEEPLGEFRTSRLPVNIVQDACTALPSYETIERMLVIFFENRQLFEINHTLDKEKVMKDFRQGFVSGSIIPLTSERLVVNLLPSEKKNYYKVAVVMSILQLVYYRSTIPHAISRFLVFMTGLSTGKVMYIERIQMQVLRFYYRITYCTSEDADHITILGNGLIQEAMRMGLNHNIRDLFKNQEKDVGNLETLENLWCWILFADFDISLLAGSPLQVLPDFLFDEAFLQCEAKDDMGLMKRYLNLVRPMQYAITSKYGKPPLDAYCESVLDFIETELPPMWYFTEAENVRKTSTMERRVLSHALSVLMVMAGLRFIAYGEKTPQLKNIVLVACLMALAISKNLLICAFRQDCDLFPNVLRPDSKELGPYLYQAISMVAKLFCRALPMFYGISYHKLTTMDQDILLNEERGVRASDLKTLRTPPDVVISLMASCEMFQKMFDQLTKQEDLKNILARSRPMTVALIIERMSRGIISKVLHLKANGQPGFTSNIHADVSVEHVAEGLVPANGDPTTQEKQPSDYPDPQFKGTVPGEAAMGNQDPEMAFSISEDFWTNYNLGWEEYMTNDGYSQYFPDFVPHE